MANQHSQSFFGQNTGIIINSSAKEEQFIYIRCIKKKSNGIWEKPSSKEGRVIKCSLDEIIMLLQVLNRDILKWQCFHTYKQTETSISFSWEDEKAKTLWINIANYSKMLRFAEAEILRLLLTHILKEKIAYATSSTTNPERNHFLEDNNFKGNFNRFKPHNQSNQHPANTKDNQAFTNNGNGSIVISTKTELVKDRRNIKGIIKGETEKALLIDFNYGKKIWIPKSTIHCQYVPQKNLTQKFLIDNWVLNRNKIIS